MDSSDSNIYIVGHSYRVPYGIADLVTIAYSSVGLPLWTNRYNEVTNDYVDGFAVAVDQQGSVYVVGTVGSQRSHFTTLAYSGAGVPLWTNVYAAPLTGQSVVTALAVDTSGESGKVYVTGWTGLDYATVAYSSSGTPLWTNLYAPTPDQLNAAEAIAVAHQGGAVFVTGRSYDNTTGMNYATVAYSSAGSVLWTNIYSGSGNNTDDPPAIAVDQQNGRVYVTGSSWGGTHSDYATVAYTAEGLPLWTNRFGPGGGQALVVDTSGNVIVTGYLGTPRSIGTIAYSPAGAPLWTNLFDGSAHGDDYPTSPSCLALGPNGSIYVAGATQAAHGATTNYDFVLLKYVPSPDIHFVATDHLPNGSVRLTISAPTNTPFSLQASTNLSNWQTLTNFPPLPISPLQYADTLAPAFPARYYRTVWSP
jgi:hypothetical protein